MANKNGDKYDKIKLCMICVQQLVDPRILPCGHKYCFTCIGEVISRTKGDFHCSRNDGIVIPRNKIASLPVYRSESDTSEENSDVDHNPSIFKQNQIYIRSLPRHMNEQLLFDTLWDEFTSVGRIQINRRTQKPFIHLYKERNDITKLNGTATVTFEDEESVMKAINEYNGKRVTSLENALIIVEMTKKGKGEFGPPPQESGTIESDDTDNTRSNFSGAETSEQNAVFIKGLPTDMPVQRLLDALQILFNRVGSIKIDQRTKKLSIYLFKKSDDKSKLNGIATITFEEEEPVMKAIERYNGKCEPSLNNNQIFVKISENIAETTPSPTPQLMPTPLRSPYSAGTEQPNGKVSIYWDIENVAIPRGQNALDIVMEIRRRLIKGRKLMERCFKVLCKTTLLTEQHKSDLHYANVDLIDVINVKNSADALIYKNLQVFREDHPEPATIVLISGDIDFAREISDLRYRYGHYVILIHNNQVTHRLIKVTDEAYPWEDFIRKNDLKTPIIPSIVEQQHIKTEETRKGPTEPEVVPSHRRRNPIGENKRGKEARASPADSTTAELTPSSKKLDGKAEPIPVITASNSVKDRKALFDNKKWINGHQ
ncbi:hypothetical protein I4U23_022446 [Adineta vaga]|nr:hypothetical protein I4U23_022446 [Adineta vaga]